MRLAQILPRASGEFGGKDDSGNHSGILVADCSLRFQIRGLMKPTPRFLAWRLEE